MKDLKKKVVNVSIKIAKKGVKDDINSTGSAWMYQPKMPKLADTFKNNK